MAEQVDGQLAALQDGGADHLVPGMRLPDVTLPATSGENVVLAQLVGRAIVYCYTWTGRPDLSDPPHWDDIPGAHGSTPQTEKFRDLYSEFQAMGVAVFGLSAQTSNFQQEMAQRLGVPFAVLSDNDLEFSGALKLPTFATGGDTFLKRLTMVIEDGVIVRVFYPVHPPQNNAREVLDWLGRRGQQGQWE